MPDRELIAAAILSGLIATKPNENPDKLVDQALKTADNLIDAAAAPSPEHKDEVRISWEDGTPLGKA